MMLSALAGAAVLAVLALPLSMAATAAVGATGAAAAAVTVLGLVFRRHVVLAAGACLFLVAYAVALLSSGDSARFGVAAGFGVALFLLLRTGDLAMHGHRALVPPAVVGRQLALWAATALGAFAAAGAAIGLARTLVPLVPLAFAPAVAAAGAVGALAALAALALRAARRS